MKKYELTKESIRLDNKTLYRIKALKEFKDVKIGDLGGFVESENNLSHNDNCWVYENARVYGNAIVCGNAKVYENAKVHGDAIVCGNAIVYGNAVVCGNAKVYGNARVCGNAKVHGDAIVYGNAVVCGDAVVCGNAKVYGNAIVCGNAKVYENAKVHGDAKVCGDAEITSNKDYIVFKNWWSSGRYFTWTRSNNMWHVDCFYGTGEELIKKAYEDSELSGREYERIVNYVKSILDEKENN